MSKFQPGNIVEYYHNQVLYYRVFIISEVEDHSLGEGNEVYKAFFLYPICDETSFVFWKKYPGSYKIIL